jgi:hypothetical protein
MTEKEMLAVSMESFQIGQTCAFFGGFFRWRKSTNNRAERWRLSPWSPFKWMGNTCAVLEDFYNRPMTEQSGGGCLRGVLSKIGNTCAVLADFLREKIDQ